MLSLNVASRQHPDALATQIVALPQRGQKSHVPHHSPEVAAAQSFPLAQR